MNETITQTASVSSGTDVLAIIVLGIIALLLLAGIVISFRILRARYLRNSVRFCIIMPDGKKITKRVKDVGTETIIGDCAYLYDDECAIRTKWSKEIYFHYNKPKAIKLLTSFSDEDLKYSAKNVKKVIDNTMVAKLLGEASVGREEIMIMISLIISGITLFMVFNFLNGGVDIAITPENTKIIADAVKQGLTGGITP